MLLDFLFKYTEAKLAREVIGICRQLDNAHSYDYDPDNHLVESSQFRIYLGNLFDLVKDKPKAERSAQIRHFIRTSLEEATISYEASSHLLVPRLKSRAEYVSWQLQLTEQDESMAILHYPLSEQFVWMMGIDGQTAIHTIMVDDLEVMSLSEPEAFKYAKVNLTAINENPFTEIEPGMYQSAQEDDHDAARILLSERISQLAFKGNPVAFVPSNNDLYLCGSEDIDAIKRMAERTLEVYQQRRPVSLSALELIDGQWRDFIPPKNADYAPIHNLHTLELSSQYEQQQGWLDKHHDEQDVDVFVATQSIYERDDSPLLFSVCVWSEDVVTWLPQADIVHFYGIVDEGEPNILGALPWEQVTELFGDLMKPLGLVPERYELKRFPDKQRLLSAFAETEQIL